IECLENTLEEEIAELRSEISSLKNFLAKLKLYLQNQGVNSADNASALPTGREVAIGYLRGCMSGRTLEWIRQFGYSKWMYSFSDRLNEAVGQSGNAIVKLRVVEGP
ncbi:2178_t:CDS:2, partial [Funneliformis geosporum]